MRTAPAPAGTTLHPFQPSSPDQRDLISGLRADRVIPWPARTSREALLMGRASIGRSLLSEADAADGPDEWFDLGGKAGRIRVITHPGDGNEIELLGLGQSPPDWLHSDFQLPGSTLEGVVVAIMNSAETWLAGAVEYVTLAAAWAGQYRSGVAVKCGAAREQLSPPGEP